MARRRCHRRLDNRRHRSTLWKRLWPQRQSKVDGNDNLGSRTEIRGNSHLSLETRTLDLWKWCWRSGFEAHLKHHFKTVSSNINMLSCSGYWSTIKTLPATLPEPRARIQEPSFGKLDAWLLCPVARCGGLEAWLGGLDPWTLRLEQHSNSIRHRI